jgi:hypothetical protein
MEYTKAQAERAYRSAPRLNPRHFARGPPPAKQADSISCTNKQHHQPIKEKNMKRILICTMTILFAFTAAFAEEVPADPEILFLDILAVMLNENEMADISGGDVKVVVVLDKDYSGTAKITVTPRYDNGKLAVHETSSYTVAVHNRVTGTAAEDTGRNDFYITSQFPEGTHTITGVSTATAGYGNSSGQWVTTDATRVVLASTSAKDGTLTGSTYLRQDAGYFWHNNEKKAFEDSKSYGCIISTKEDMDKVAATIKGDTSKKSVKTITVIQPKEKVPLSPPEPAKAKATPEPVKSTPKVSKPLLR